MTANAAQSESASTRAWFRRIALKGARSGFPAFPGGEERCTPFNASPYLVALGELQEILPGADRARLLDALHRTLEALPALGAIPRVLLLGGSALDPGARPNDLDVVVFYAGTSDLQPGALAGFQREQAAHAVDLRLVPIDGDPALLLKAALFFGGLYGRRKRGEGHARGLLLVDCGKAGR